MSFEDFTACRFVTVIVGAVGGGCVHLQAFRGRGARRGGVAASSRLVGRVGGISQRSRTIVSGAVRRAQRQQQLVLATPIRKIRGRGSARLGQLVSDEPIAEEEELVEVVRAPRVQPRREIVVRRRPVVVERSAYIPPMARRGGVQKRVVVQQRPRVVVVNRQRPQVVERVPRIQQAPRYVTVAGTSRGGRGRPQPNRQKLFRMREAFGIGRPVQVVERFEPSSSFLQRVPASNRRGRGFRTERVVYQ